MFSQTSEIEENKMSFIFLNFCSGAEIQPLSYFLPSLQLQLQLHLLNMTISSNLTSSLTLAWLSSGPASLVKFVIL